MEKCAENVMFVIISDIWLDNEDVIIPCPYFFFVSCFVSFSLSFCFLYLSNLNNVLSVE